MNRRGDSGLDAESGRPQRSKSIDLREARRVQVRKSKSDSGSKPKACGIRADSRLFFSQVSTHNQLLPELNPSQHRVTPIKIKHVIFTADRTLNTSQLPENSIGRSHPGQPVFHFTAGYSFSEMSYLPPFGRQNLITINRQSIIYLYHVRIHKHQNGGTHQIRGKSSGDT